MSRCEGCSHREASLQHSCEGQSERFTVLSRKARWSNRRVLETLGTSMATGTTFLPGVVCGASVKPSSCHSTSCRAFCSAVFIAPSSQQHPSTEHSAVQCSLCRAESTVPSFHSALCRAVCRIEFTIPSFHSTLRSTVFLLQGLAIFFPQQAFNVVQPNSHSASSQAPSVHRAPLTAFIPQYALQALYSSVSFA